MRMCFQSPSDFEALVLNELLVALNLLVDRIDDDRIQRVGVINQIGVGAGRGVKQLNDLSLGL